MADTAIIVVDMLNDNVGVESERGVGEEGRKIIPNILRLLSTGRKANLPIIFANDSFLPGDFVFREGRLHPHAIKGTQGAQVVPELQPQDSDIILEKRRFSAFLGTGLDAKFRGMGIKRIAVAGINTHVCVLTTILDGIQHDFRAVLLEDCCASYKRAPHEAVTNIYRRGTLYPLLQVMKLDEFLGGYAAEQKSIGCQLSI